MIITSFEGFVVPEANGKGKPHIRKIFTGHWMCRTEPSNMYEIWTLAHDPVTAYLQWVKRNRS